MSQDSSGVVRGFQYRVRLPASAGRRTLDERVLVRFPALYRVLAGALMRMLPRPRMRRHLFARVVRRGYAAANRRDWEVLLMSLDPGIEYHPREDTLGPDQPAAFYGHAGYSEMWRIWLDAFEDLRLEPEEVLDLGDTFLVTTRFKARGSGSGVPIDEPFVQLFKLRRGLAVWQRDFGYRAEALEAAGLRE
jgi:ketosteroid isomerase-like protein